jgi:predicted  nucleic acid-binding Zn-ribbon protein
MIDELESLKLLQEIDLRIREQELAQEQFPVAVKDLQSAIENAQTVLENSTKKLKKAEADKVAFDEGIQKSHDMLDKSQERLNSIKTNREYDAVHAEIETQKNTINTSETRRKNLNDEIEKLKAIVEQNTSEAIRIKSENEPKIAELNEKIAAIDSIIAKITKEREVILPKIRKQYLRTYDLIRSKKKSGRAVSIIKGPRTCSVCFKVLEPQLYNEIKRGLKLILCQNCGSILIWDEPSPK